MVIDLILNRHYTYSIFNSYVQYKNHTYIDRANRKNKKLRKLFTNRWFIILCVISIEKISILYVVTHFCVLPSNEDYLIYQAYHRRFLFYSFIYYIIIYKLYKFVFINYLTKSILFYYTIGYRFYIQ